MHSKAFTVIELTIVILIIGIIAAVSISQMPDMLGVRIDQAAYKIQSDVRYAQRLAMQLQRRVAVFFSTTSNYYALYIENTYGGNDWNFSAPADDPLTHQDFVVQLNRAEFSEVTITAVVFNAETTLMFDRNGDPYSMQTSPPYTSSPLANFGYACLNNRKYIVVQGETGRVSVQNAAP